jgi:hypothetical protein
MENFENSEIGSESTLQLTEKMKEYLTDAAKWTKFMAIVGFVLLGLLFVGFIVVAISSSLLVNIFPGMDVFGGLQIGVFLFAFIFYGMLIFLPSWYMFRFGSKTLKSIPIMDVRGMEVAFDNLKSLFKFYGILMCVGLSLYAILIVVFISIKTF